MGIVKEERIGGQRLILGDCLEVMPLLGKVDAVVTDPPYGVLDEAWDDMDEAQLAAFTMQWAGRIRQMTEKATIFFGQKTRRTIQDVLYLLFPEIRQIIWSKGGGTAASDGMFYSYESAYFCRPKAEPEVLVGPRSMRFAAALKKAREAVGMSRGQVDIAIRGKKTGLCYRWEEACCLPTEDQAALLRHVLEPQPDFWVLLEEARADCKSNVMANLQRTIDGAASRLDVLRYPSPSGIGHPTSKPIGLMQDLIEVTGGQTILDPFLGSGTTLVACQRLGRQGTGIELDPEYFAIACKRVDEATRQPDLFIKPAEPKPEQQGLDL
jgi:DNA modification methylase